MKIVYQAYGRQDIIQQVLFSVTTLHAQCEGHLPGLVEIHTDQPNLLKAFFGEEPQVSIVELSPAQIQADRGAIDFVHRVKLKILERASKGFEGRLVYLDGDTYFLRNPSELFSQIKPHVSLMHVCESRLDTATDPLTKKIARFVRKNQFQIHGEKVQIPISTEMWNAGVIGMHTKLLDGAKTNALTEMIELTDQMYSLYQKHVMEQLAVSYVLQERTLVQPSHFGIVHYWASKEEFDQAIGAFFRQNPTFPQALEGLREFPWPAPIQRRDKKPWYKRLFSQSKSGL